MQNKLIDIQLFEIDNYENTVKSINEATVSNNAGGNYTPIFVTGTIQRADSKNKNGRIYPKSTLTNAVNVYIENKVKNGNALGELDHPDYNSISLKNASHNIKEIWWENNDVKAKIELLDTPSGNILKALVKSKINLGISSRGFGSVKSIKVQNEGKEEYLDQIQEDFKLTCWDFVSDPSTHNAYMSVKENENIDEKTIKLNYLNDKITELFTSIFNNINK